MTMNITNGGYSQNTSNDGNLPPYVEEPYKQYVILAVQIISVVFGTSGNLTIVIVRIIRQLQRNNTTAYTFLVGQLAIADFIFALFIVFDIYWSIHRKWGFGLAGCRVIKLIQSGSLTTTIGLLTIMAYERYCGISRPLQHHWSLKKTSIMVLIMWTYVFITFVPMLTALDIKHGQCIEVNHPSESFRKAYTIFLFVSSFVLPLVCISVFHTLIIWRMKKHLKKMKDQRHHSTTRNSCRTVEQSAKNNTVMSRTASTTSTYSVSDETAMCGSQYRNCWIALYKLLSSKCTCKDENGNKTRRNTKQNQTENQSRRRNRSTNVLRRIIQSKKTNEDRKLIQMLLAVTLTFGIMTCPTQIWYILYDFVSKGIDKFLVLVELLSCFVYLHCCSNCLIYSVMDKRFRADVSKTFRFIFNCRQEKRLSRKTFERVTVVSRLSRASRHYSTRAMPVYTTKQTASAEEAMSPTHLLEKKQPIKKQITFNTLPVKNDITEKKAPIDDKNDNNKTYATDDNVVFIYEKETVIL